MKSLIALTMLLLLPMAAGCGGQVKTEQKANSNQNEVGKTGVTSTPITEPPSAHKEKANSNQNEVSKTGVTSTPITEPPSAHKEELRTWKDASGKHSTEARFVRLDVGSRSVCLTAKEGKDVHVAFSKLSREDQDYILEVDAKRQDVPTIGRLALVALDREVLQVFEQKAAPLPQHREGLLVMAEVPNGSPASVAGLCKMDIIYTFDDIPIKTMEDYVWATEGMKTGQSCKIFVERISDDDKRWDKKVLTVVPLTRSEVTKAINNAPPAPPLKLAGGVLDNSIGVPEVKIGGQNLTDKAIVAFVVELQCFDRFDNPVLGSGGKNNKVPAICQETIKAKATFVHADELRTITLGGHETATVIKVYLKKVKFEDGSEWDGGADGVYMCTATSSK